ncbi:MAG: peptidylprolyl isomerase, partial [Microbacteriaceae bacterium]|nr:peptidylprolyl isomerase [Microbacteriaceae bacterium]
VTGGLDQLQTEVIDAGVQNGDNDGKPVVDVRITNFTLQ